MPKRNYDIYHQSFINPLLRGLKNAGASIERISSKSNIRRFNFQNPEAYLPMDVLYDFLLTVSNDQPVDNLADSFYSNFQLKELGDFGEFITERQDLHTVILDGIKYEPVIQTNTKMNLEVLGAFSRFSTTHLDPPSEGRQIAEEIAFSMAMKAFRMVLGDGWRPNVLEIPKKSGYWIEKIIPLDGVKIKHGSLQYAWIFETKLLNSPNQSHTIKVFPPQPGSTNLSEVIQKLLNSYSDGYLPTCTDFSNILNISERTIVRILSSEGTKYSSLLERFLFQKAIKYLEDDSLSVLEISQRLGYSNPPNFIRTFKKWTNCTPDKYRKMNAGPHRY